jgi:hypothetical protein
MAPLRGRKGIRIDPLSARPIWSGMNDIIRTYPVRAPGPLSQDLDGELREAETTNQQVARVRDALGAVPAGDPAVFWLYQDFEGEWCVRQEGAASEQRFPTRDEARSFVMVEVARCRSYRLFIARRDGRFIVELFNWPPAKHHEGGA